MRLQTLHPALPLLTAREIAGEFEQDLAEDLDFAAFMSRSGRYYRVSQRRYRMTWRAALGGVALLGITLHVLRAWLLDLLAPPYALM